MAVCDGETNRLPPNRAEGERVTASAIQRHRNNRQNNRAGRNPAKADRVFAIPKNRKACTIAGGNRNEGISHELLETDRPGMENGKMKAFKEKEGCHLPMETSMMGTG